MGKALAGYKDKMIQIVMNAAYIHESFNVKEIAARLRKKIEFTGIPDRDILTLANALTELLTELNEGCL